MTMTLAKTGVKAHILGSHNPDFDFSPTRLDFSLTQLRFFANSTLIFPKPDFDFSQTRL
jgi:hypothetical protein